MEAHKIVSLFVVQGFSKYNCPINNDNIEIFGKGIPFNALNDGC